MSKKMIWIATIALLAVLVAIGYVLHKDSPPVWNTYTLPEGSISIPNNVRMKEETSYRALNRYTPEGGSLYAALPFKTYSFAGEQGRGFDEGDFFSQEVTLMFFADSSYLAGRPTNVVSQIGPSSWLYYSNALLREGLWEDTPFNLVKETPEYYIYSYKRTQLNQALILISKGKPYIISFQYRSAISDKEALSRLEKIQELLVI